MASVDTETLQESGDHYQNGLKEAAIEDSQGNNRIDGDQNKESKCPDGLSIRTSFFRSLPQFPFIDNDTKAIPTIELLSASSGIVQFVDLLGIVFKPVSSDLNGNVIKIRSKYQECPEKYKYLNEILIEEKATIKDGDFRIGSDAICWLNRGLKYLCLFLTFLVQDYEDARDGKSAGSLEDLKKYFAQAYEFTLKNHHGWFTQKMFSLCLLSAPTRNNLIGMLLKPVDGADVEGEAMQECDESALFGHISNYLVNLKAVNDTIDQLFIDLNIKI